ncbi:serine/threonine protein phosphatase [Caulobacter sp. Root656]|nr:serine/threonine protein phosphatase [Caulobacter sp. Root656]
MPPGTLVWTVGDIHGRLDLLRPLLSAVLEDFARSAQTRKVLIFLGDYVDRGPDSQGVIELLCRLADGGPVETIFLRGNHEDRMAAFLEDPGIGPTWCDYGGREALRSYGVTAPADRADKDAWAAASADFNAAVSDRHRAFLRDLKFSASVGDYFFVHAGARPGVPLDQQSRHDMMWIRQTFLDDSRAFEKIVVHGHTPTDDIQSDHRRIGLDTGAYATGVLTAVRLEGEERAALQTAMTGSGVELWRSEVETTKGAKRSAR